MVFATVLLGALTASSADGYAQAHSFRGGSCQSCSLVLESRITLGRTTDDQVGHTNILVRDSRGRYFTTDHYRQSEISVYNAEGSLLKRFGRAGDGPGEYRDIADLAVGPGDSVHVVDSKARHTVIDPAKLEAIRTAQLPAPLRSLLVDADGRLIGNANVSTEDRVGLPIHLIDEGGFVRSFGSIDRLYRRDWDLMMHRELAPATSGRVWSATLSRYSVELWDTAGNRRAWIGAPGNWFEPWTVYRGIRGDEKPQPVVSDIRQVGTLLIVLAHVPASEWKANVEQRTFPSGRVYFAERTRGAAYDTRLDVFDARSFTHLGSVTLDAYFLSFVSDDELGEPAETAEGQEFMRIWSFALSGPRLQIPRTQDSPTIH